MKITLNQHPVGDYLGKKTLGTSLASQDIYLIDTLNRILVDAMQEKSQKCQRFMDYLFQRALVNPTHWNKSSFALDGVSQKAWQLCQDSQHPVLGLAVLRQMRAEAFLVQTVKQWVSGREIIDQIDQTVAGYADEKLKVGMHINGQSVGSATHLYCASGKQLLKETPDAYWYHNESLHIPYAVEAKLPFIGGYILAKGYAIKAIEKLFSDLVLRSSFLNVFDVVGREVENERHRHLMEQLQLACMWLTGYRNGQQGLPEDLAQEAYSELVFGAI